MSHHLSLSPRDKLKIERLYAKGLKPAEICAELPSLKLTPRQVTQFLYKRGWTKRRAEIEVVKQQTALEILQRVQKEGVEDFEAVIQDIAAGLRIDAKKLRDGWDLVEDASGASSLMRAKNLHLGRSLQFFGVAERTAEPPTTTPSGIELFYLDPKYVTVPPEKRAVPIRNRPSPPPAQFLGKGSVGSWDEKVEAPLPDKQIELPPPTGEPPSENQEVGD
jgi:hypothetical protein